uniref:OSJNBb0115I09.13 protein n=1 Tax=Oryza sativa subsp. japonica TaxID=39947 RepID=Q7XL99_ORYSJ|nr:OSJNBb0115I09.13 [Oryza sativa Japonica Group]
MAEERELAQSQWALSDVKESTLLEMVEHCVLPSKEIIGWHLAFGEAFPTPDTDEIMPNKRNPCLVGGSGLQLRGSLSKKYFSLPFKSSNKGWHSIWFYIHNPSPSLPEYSCTPPVYNEIWSSLPMGDELSQAKHPPGKNAENQRAGTATGASHLALHQMLTSSDKREVKACLRVQGPNCPNHEDPDSLDFKITKARMYTIFSTGIEVDYSQGLPVTPFNIFNLPPKENALYSSKPFSSLPND